MFARLESPPMLAIERRGSTMTIASSRAQQSTFEADGIERQEQVSGRWSRVTATLTGDQLGVRSTGYRESDFNVTFESIENRRRLRVRREIYSDRLNEPVIVNSIYDRTSDTPQWNIYDGSASLPGNTGANVAEFLTRDGETVVAVLNNDILHFSKSTSGMKTFFGLLQARLLVFRTDKDVIIRSLNQVETPPFFSTPEKDVKRTCETERLRFILATEWFHKPKHET